MACCIRFSVHQWQLSAATKFTFRSLHFNTFSRPNIVCSTRPLSVLVARSSPRLTAANEYHTGLVLCAKKDSGEKISKGKGSKSSQEHGSVLMQFVEKKDEPKAVTVGAKGGLKHSLHVQLWSV